MYTKSQDGSYIVCGFVPQDAVLHQTKTGKTFATWSVKAGEKDGNPMWVNCKAWGGLSLTAGDIHKGDSVLAVGRIEESEWQGKQYKNLVCEFVSIARSEMPQSVPTQAQTQAQTPPPIPHYDSVAPPELDDIIFPF